MFKIPFLIFIFLGAAFAQNSAWSQCGSPTWIGSVECVTGYSCYIQDYYYSQCRPTGDCPSYWNCSIFKAPDIKNNSLSDWSQCGGPNWNSSSICTANFVFNVYLLIIFFEFFNYFLFIAMLHSKPVWWTKMDWKI